MNTEKWLSNNIDVKKKWSLPFTEEEENLLNERSKMKKNMVLT